MTREVYLNAGVEALRPIFAVHNAPLPAKIRVSTGNPLNFRRTGELGETLPDTSSSDGHFNVLISPTLEDPVAVFEVLVNQLCRCTSGALSYQSNAYVSIATLMGLTCGAHATGDSTFADKYVEIIAELGVYPHGAVSYDVKKKQTTRMLKAVCECLGADPHYTVRLTEKWALMGMPICPMCNSSMTLTAGVQP